MMRGVNKGIKVELYTIRIKIGKNDVSEPMEFFETSEAALERATEAYERFGYKTKVQKELVTADIKIK